VRSEAVLTGSHQRPEVFEGAPARWHAAWWDAPWRTHAAMLACASGVTGSAPDARKTPRRRADVDGAACAYTGAMTSSDALPPSETIHFIELAAPDARDVLSSLARRVAAPDAPPELLRSVERDDLWLLVLRGAALPGALPDGARTWHFTTAELAS
jgi:hypothetical protein